MPPWVGCVPLAMLSHSKLCYSAQRDRSIDGAGHHVNR